MLYIMYIVSILLALILGIVLYRYSKPVRFICDKIFGKLDETKQIKKTTERKK